MPYATLPDRRMPYDNDGTVVGYGSDGLTNGLQAYFSNATLIELQDNDYVPVSAYFGNTAAVVVWAFFPEQREVTAYYAIARNAVGGGYSPTHSWQGSNDTTNGLDGTWETASLSSGIATYGNVYSWRSDIKPISFTGGKRVVRLIAADAAGNDPNSLLIMHIYGEKTAGQTPNDLIFIDHDTTPGVEYAAPEDFGDRPLGTTVTRQFRVKNASATLTANTINIQCNDVDFAISTDSVTWVVTINIGSLGAGAESATMYIRNTTPAAGNLLGPRFARIITTVGSWT